MLNARAKPLACACLPEFGTFDTPCPAEPPAPANGFARAFIEIKKFEILLISQYFRIILIKMEYAIIEASGRQFWVDTRLFSSQILSY